ncbi:hypothetical protein GCM10027290_28360 [Micromonospora sonneratiae]|uniref:WD40 repeat domain-containing protein n=1 Tax=Micromonospora sonneratiae TaxID=1184706 RepID=A0ABW3YAA7_9ACTN
MTDRQLTEMLHRIADQARPARVHPDIWPRARRRRRITTVLAVVAVAVVAGALTGTPLLLDRTIPDDFSPARRDPPVVPSTVYPPLTGEDTIVESPPGPAAIVVSGDEELRGSDIWGWEGRSLVIGRDGGYRLARTVGETTAGMADGLLISPDGRQLASQPWLEGASADGGDRTAVFDLTSGKVTEYDGGTPIAWAPDGRSLLVLPTPSLMPDPEVRQLQLRLLDLTTGTVRELPKIRGTYQPGNFVAFSPDSARIAVATRDAIHIVDPNRATVRRLAPLSPGDRLAGPGAWLADGNRIAVFSTDTCEGDTACDESALRRRSWQIGYLDVPTGAPVAGPTLPPARGLAARLLGWQDDGDAVVAVYRPEEGVVKRPDDDSWSETDWWTVGGVELMEFRSDGSQHRLVDLPENVLFVDVPTRLLDSFGGPSASWPEGILRRLLAVAWPFGQCLLFALVVMLALGSWQHHRRRSARRASYRGPEQPA